MRTPNRQRAAATVGKLTVTFIMALSSAACMSSGSATTRVDAQLAALVASPERTPAFAARDGARHPAEELRYFGIKPTMTVIELWPAPGYWTEIIGPYLAANGHYVVAQEFKQDSEANAGLVRWTQTVEKQKSRLGPITQTSLGLDHYELAPAGSADLIITFRNLHNWLRGGYADAVLAACFRALKPGGVLGIEDHRGRTDRPQDPKAADGYVRQDYAIALAQRAGFEFTGSSELNSNPKDTKDWVDGVWTLPPALSQGDKDRARYVAIGDADNFVLKFRKPSH